MSFTGTRSTHMRNVGATYQTTRYSAFLFTPIHDSSLGGVIPGRGSQSEHQHGGSRSGQCLAAAASAVVPGAGRRVLAQPYKPREIRPYGHEGRAFALSATSLSDDRSASSLRRYRTVPVRGRLQ